jgi:WD40 repeat protein
MHTALPVVCVTGWMVVPRPRRVPTSTHYRSVGYLAVLLFHPPTVAVSSSLDSQIKIWDLEQGNLIKVMLARPRLASATLSHLPAPAGHHAPRV